MVTNTDEAAAIHVKLRELEQQALQLRTQLLELETKTVWLVTEEGIALYTVAGRDTANGSFRLAGLSGTYYLGESVAMTGPEAQKLWMLNFKAELAEHTEGVQKLEAHIRDLQGYMTMYETQLAQAKVKVERLDRLKAKFEKRWGVLP